MMAKKTFTVPQAPGSSRKSDRDYTHAIICKFDADAYRSGLEARLEACDNKHERSNFAYYQEKAAASVGQLVNGYRITQDEIDSAKSIMANRGTAWDAWLASVRQQERDRTERRLAEESEQFVVLQWSMSEVNARKALGSWEHQYRKELQVVQCVQVNK